MNKFIYKKMAGITALSASISDFRYKKHSHEEYAIGVTLRGIQQYNLGGSLYSSHENGIMLFNPEQPHDGNAYNSEGFDYVMLYIDQELISQVLDQEHIIKFSSSLIYDYALKQRILNLSDAVLNEKDEALCSELIISLVDCLSSTNIPPVYRKDRVLINKARNMIHSNLKDVLSIDDICREFDMSKFRFIRMFEAGTGISPYQYYLNSKVELAKQLIEKDKDVYSAVEQCGFVDLAHLNRHFKGKYGITAFKYKSNFH